MKNLSLFLLAVITLPLQVQAAAPVKKTPVTSPTSGDTFSTAVVTKQPSASAAVASEDMGVASREAYEAIFGEIDPILKANSNKPVTAISGFTPHDYRAFSLEELQALAMNYFLPKIRSLRTQRQEAFFLDAQAAALYQQAALLTDRNDHSKQERLTALATELTDRATAIKRIVPEEKTLYGFFRSLGALIKATHQKTVIEDRHYKHKEATTYLDSQLTHAGLPEPLRKEVKFPLTREFAEVEYLPLSRIDAFAKEVALPLKKITTAYPASDGSSTAKGLLDVFFYDPTQKNQENVHVRVLDAHQLITHQDVNTPTLQIIKQEYPSEPLSLTDCGTVFFEKAITTAGNPLDTLYAIEGAKFPKGKDPIVVDPQAFSLHYRKQELQLAVGSIDKEIALTEGRLRDLKAQVYPKKKEHADLEILLQIQRKEKCKLDTQLKRVTLLREIQKAAGINMRNAYPEIEGAKVPNQSKARAVASALWSLLPTAPTLSTTTETEPKTPASIWLETVESFANEFIAKENAIHAARLSGLEGYVSAYAASDSLKKRINAGYPRSTEEVTFSEKSVDGFMATYQKLVRSKNAIMKQLLSPADYIVWRSLQPASAPAASDLSESVEIEAADSAAPASHSLKTLATAGSSHVATASAALASDALIAGSSITSSTADENQ